MSLQNHRKLGFRSIDSRHIRNLESNILTQCILEPTEYYCPKTTGLFYLRLLEWKDPTMVGTWTSSVQQTFSAQCVPGTLLDSRGTGVKKTAQVIALNAFAESARM